MKAILVIDIPDEYNNKDIYVLHEIYEYKTNRYERIEEYKEGLKLLKPMPEHNWHEEGIEDECLEWYKNGWNDCIDEILGVEDDR